MSDAQVKGLLAAGLLVQAGAVALAFRTPWAIPAAALLIAPVSLAFTRRLWPFAAGVAALVAGQALAPSPLTLWLVRIAFGLEALAQLALLVFLMTFRMKRLW